MCSCVCVVCVCTVWCTHTHTTHTPHTHHTHTPHTHAHTHLHTHTCTHAHTHTHTPPSLNINTLREKWVIQLSWKEKGGKQKWTSQDSLTLLQQLAAMEVVDEDEVEWGELCKGWDSARSPYYLRGRWSVLRRDVPNYRLMAFQGQPLQYLVFMKVYAL